jgi:hypothetical protein
MVVMVMMVMRYTKVKKRQSGRAENQQEKGGVERIKVHYMCMCEKGCAGCKDRMIKPTTVFKKKRRKVVWDYNAPGKLVQRSLCASTGLSQ